MSGMGSTLQSPSSGGSGWSRSQVINVTIPYGSSG